MQGDYRNVNTFPLGGTSAHPPVRAGLKLPSLWIDDSVPTEDTRLCHIWGMWSLDKECVSHRTCRGWAATLSGCHGGLLWRFGGSRWEEVEAQVAGH